MPCVKLFIWVWLYLRLGGMEMERRATVVALLFLFVFAVQVCFPLQQLSAQRDMSQEPMNHHDMQGMDVMPGMGNMPMAAPSPAYLAKLEADKRFSEFNHRF